MGSSLTFRFFFSFLVHFKKSCMTSMRNMISPVLSIEKTQWPKPCHFEASHQKMPYTILNCWYLILTTVRRKESHCALAYEFSKLPHKLVPQFSKQSNISSKMKFKFTSLHKVFMLFQSDHALKSMFNGFIRGFFVASWIEGRFSIVF